MDHLRRPHATSRRDRRAATRFVVERLRSDGVPHASAAEMSPAFADLVAATAERHGVAAQLYARIREDAAVPATLMARLKGRHDAALAHHFMILWELKRLNPVLDASGAGWVVIKGPVAAELLYDSPAERWYADLDVLVDPARLPEAIASLRKTGARLLDRNWAAIRRELRGELHFELPGSSLLDLHWNLVNIYRGRIRIDTRAMLGRREYVELGGFRVPTLDPTDSLIHLALHGTLSGGHRLLWMLDVANASRRRPPDWNALVERAREWNVAVPVGHMLRRTASVLGAAIPAGVPEELLGARYRWLAAAVDAVSPWDGGQRLTSPSLLLTRSMGYGGLGALSWLVRRGIQNLRPGQEVASSSFAEHGSAEDYAAFVEAVVSSAEPSR